MKDKSNILTVVNTGKKKPQKSEVVQQVVVPASSSSHAPSFNSNLYLLKSVWDSVFEIKTDVSGQKYIFGKLPVLTKYGVTMYADDGSLNLPSIYEGLPIDGVTLYWDNGVLKAKGGEGGGGGVADSIDWANVYGKPSWVTDTKPIYNYSEIKNTPDLSVFVTDTALSNTLADYATLTHLTGELKKYVTIKDDQNIEGVKNFLNGIKISNMPIRKLQDDVIYIDANVVVRGGVTMYYQDGEVDLPSIIDEIGFAGYNGSVGLASFDSSQFVISANGTVSVKGGSTGLDTAQLRDYLDSNKYTTETWVKEQDYASASSLSSLQTKVNNFLEGSDTDTIINKWKELEAFLSGLTESDNLATILTGKADKSYVDTNFVTIAGTEDVTGLHNFVNGLKVGGIELIQKNGNVFLKGNLVVEGGITMYGDGEGGSSAPTYPTLGSLENVDKDAIDAVASVDRVLFQSAGSNVWSWKALSEIGGGSSGGSVSGAVRYLSTLGSTGVWYDTHWRLYAEWGVHSRVYLKTEDGYDVVANLAEKDGNGNIIASTYLPLSGGTLTGNLTLGNSSNTSHIGYYINRSGNSIGLAPDYNCACLRFATSTSNTNFLRLANGVLDLSYDGGTNWNNILHAGNYSSYALPLSGGTIDSNNTSPLALKSNVSECGIRFELGSNSRGWIGYNLTHGVTLYNYFSQTYGISLRDNGNVILCQDGGYVGIGVSSPDCRVDVAGDIATNNYLRIKAWPGYGNGSCSIWFDGNSNTAHISSNILVSGGITMYSDQRKKTILNHVELSLKQIADAPLIEHYYNSDQDKTTHVGSIAQYWAGLNDWFCKLDNEGFYTMEIQNCALASAISIARHLEKYETKTDKTIRKMKQRIQELEDEVERLKKGE